MIVPGPTRSVVGALHSCHLGEASQDFNPGLLPRSLDLPGLLVS